MSSIAESEAQSEILSDSISETVTLTSKTLPDSASETATLTNESHALEFTTTRLGQGLTGSPTTYFPRPNVTLLRIYNHRQPTSLPDELRPTLARYPCTEGKAHYELHFLITGPGISDGLTDDRDMEAAQIPAVHIAELFGSTELTRRAHDTASREEEDAITREAFDKLSNIVEASRQTYQYLQPLAPKVYEKIIPELIHSCHREWEERTVSAPTPSGSLRSFLSAHLRRS